MLKTKQRKFKEEDSEEVKRKDVEVELKSFGKET